MDKKILFLGIIFVLIFEFQYIYLPNKRKLENIEKLISKKEKEFGEFLELCEKYKKNEKGNDKLKTASDKFSFFTYLNDLIDGERIRENVSEIKILPREENEKYILEKIQITLNLISLEKLLSLLEKIEKTKGLYIVQFEERRDKNKPYLLNTSIIIGCLKSK